MDFVIEEWTLSDLIFKHEHGYINLNPPYQRGDIWTMPAKKKLIESIKLKYPLPAFFLFKNEVSKYEMVDGQQRTRTILGYAKGLFPDINKQEFEDSDKDFFLNHYKISVFVITIATQSEIEDFYYRVNKFGTKLNRPEILKAQYSNSPLQNLIERISDSPQFESIELFTQSTLNRLTDFDFIGELLGILKFGITDKKLSVDRWYQDSTFSEPQAEELERRFFVILDDVIRFNEIYPLKNTRYRQRNDFYTLFCFLINTQELKKSSLDHFYKILVLIGEDISPSQEECFAFQEYATNCVSQSNSKNAREERLRFFNELLLNTIQSPISTESKENLTIVDVLNFYHLPEDSLVMVENYTTIDIWLLQERTQRYYFKQ
ncbi:hypothetical protein GCM10027275_10510 [Rhabdobacter roseus]|uniref:GmrSD restriction endonucleases N-terminal domain-containing protein n=1 Tax=Rhabdobacter roseus TaxID=1655419 RepID=A0A840TSI1_9BACT|nr:DUF262 domain-containing protein [Rhabdobacter roseus]MBB5282960.1 hypothetical protein [Rhabdobacter roseus]